MSKNKFRALLLLVLVSNGVPNVNLYEGTPESFFTALLQFLDIVVNATFIIGFCLAFYFGIYYGILAWKEDEKN